MENSTITEESKKFNIYRRLGYLSGLIQKLVIENRLSREEVNSYLNEIDKFPIPSNVEEKDKFVNILTHKSKHI